MVLVYLEGTPPKGVGPQDVALALVAETFPNGDVKNKILEFAGPGVAGLSADYRIGIDVMTTETSCLSSIWETDEVIEAYYKNVGRPEAYQKLSLEEGAYYDSVIKIDLSKMECMIALPFHPSKAYTIHQLQENAAEIFAQVEEDCNRQLGGKVEMDLRRHITPDGKIQVDQGIIVGCSGGMYENIMVAAEILNDQNIGNDAFEMSVYPSSTAVGLAITQDGAAEKLMKAGAVMKPAFCGPALAREIPRPTMPFPSATPPGILPTGRLSRDRVRFPLALMMPAHAATARNGGISPPPPTSTTTSRK